MAKINIHSLYEDGDYDTPQPKIKGKKQTSKKKKLRKFKEQKAQ